MNDYIVRLKDLVVQVVNKQKYEGLLFSGGLDTSIIAAINPKITALTISLEGKADDIYYANLLARKLKFRHLHYPVDIDEALAAIPQVIKILHSFDPAMPNDLAAYFGFKKAKELGLSSVATGDASDELFAGYSFMRDISNLESYISRIAANMVFSSNDIADFFGINLIQPFRDKEIIDFALNTPRELKIREENGKIWGKWILRKAFEDELSQDLAWQSKRPLEYGSGMTRLRKIITAKISDDEFREKQKIYPVKFLNKEHLYYYEIYRKELGEIPVPKQNEKPCPGCGTGMKIKALHCKVCGYVLEVDNFENRK